MRPIRLSRPLLGLRNRLEGRLGRHRPRLQVIGHHVEYGNRGSQGAYSSSHAKKPQSRCRWPVPRSRLPAPTEHAGQLNGRVTIHLPMPNLTNLLPSSCRFEPTPNASRSNVVETRKLVKDSRRSPGRHLDVRVRRSACTCSRRRLTASLDPPTLRESPSSALAHRGNGLHALSRFLRAGHRLDAVPHDTSQFTCKIVRTMRMLRMPRPGTPGGW